MGIWRPRKNVAFIIGGCLIIFVFAAFCGLLSNQKPVKAESKKPDVTANRDNEKQVNERLSKMTVEEKVGQVMMVYFHGPVLSDWTAKQIKAIHPGGVILYDITNNIDCSNN